MVLPQSSSHHPEFYGKSPVLAGGAGGCRVFSGCRPLNTPPFPIESPFEAFPMRMITRAIPLLAVSSLLAAPLVLSGKVTDKAGHPAWGVDVLLANSPGTIQATTDSNGLWRIGGVSGAFRKAPSAGMQQSRILFEDGRLVLAFEGRKIDGRAHRPATGSSPLAPYAPVVAARARSAADTLLFSLDGEIRGRLAVTVEGDVGNMAISLEGLALDARDGKSYGSVRIGSQTWLNRNLEFSADDSWTYGSSPDSIAKHGRLYTWAAAMGLPDSCNRASCLEQVRKPHRGACPAGWHVPTQGEWRRVSERAGITQLMSDGIPLGTAMTPIYVLDDLYRQIIVGYKQDTLVGSDSYGFHGHLSGFRKPDGNLATRDSSLWWTTDHLDTDYEDHLTLFEVNPTHARAWKVHALPTSSFHAPIPKLSGLSLRCLAD